MGRVIVDYDTRIQKYIVSYEDSCYETYMFETWREALEYAQQLIKGESYG